MMQLHGEAIDLELKNATIVHGTITGVDPNMNTHLKNVTLTVKNRNPQQLEFLSVRGASVRHFVLSQNAELDPLLKRCVQANPTGGAAAEAPAAAPAGGRGGGRGGRGGRGGGFGDRGGRGFGDRGGRGGRGGGRGRGQ